MRFWLMKSEPNVFSIDDLEQLSTFNESFFKEVLKKYIKQ